MESMPMPNGGTRIFAPVKANCINFIIIALVYLEAALRFFIQN